MQYEKRYLIVKRLILNYIALPRWAENYFCIYATINQEARIENARTKLAGKLQGLLDQRVNEIAKYAAVAPIFGVGTEGQDNSNGTFGYRIPLESRTTSSDETPSEITAYYNKN